MGYSIALLLWVSLPVLFFSRKTFYFAFVAVALLAGGSALSEWCPLLWAVPEFFLTVRDSLHSSRRVLS